MIPLRAMDADTDRTSFPAGHRVSVQTLLCGSVLAGLLLADLVAADAPKAAPSSPARELAYAPAPPDNPLKGFVPYLRADATFPHSLEWDYMRLSDVMTGPSDFHWAPFESKLAAAASRGHQFVVRFYIEWPGRSPGVPQHLLDAGVRLRTWTNTNTQPFPPAVDHTPDYEDPRQRAIRAAQQMGYELHVTTAELETSAAGLTVSLSITNTGVAPFYCDWPVELAALNAADAIAATWRTDWKLTGVLPGEPARLWRAQFLPEVLPAGECRLLLRVPNPLANGAPLRFANETQDEHLPGYLTLGSFERPISAEPQTVAGWAMHIHPRLWETNSMQTKRALELLGAQLEEIVRVVPGPALAELRRVPLWLSPEYPGTPPTAEYHPDAGWLRGHGRNPAMAKAVEFTNVRIFEEERRRMPNFVLHELAHAYHDRVLGFDEPRILAAYEKARAGGAYDRVERRDARGRVKLDRAYALQDPKEYFAETTEAFFSANDFYPFTREELKRHDLGMFRLLEALWSDGRTP